MNAQFNVLFSAASINVALQKELSKRPLKKSFSSTLRGSGTHGRMQSVKINNIGLINTDQFVSGRIESSR
jgi:hypothetical protein